MKHTILLFLVAITLSAPAHGVASRPPNVGTKVGQIAPDFSLPQRDGTPISLSQLRGRIVLLDFWASWCKGCRHKQGLVALYNQYRDSAFVGATGFTVLSVSLDKDRSSWLAAIEQDGLPWLHACDFLSTASPVCVAYRVGALPQNWLIDSDGTILAHFASYSDVEAVLKKRLKGADGRVRP